jgi:hypothetical protein
MNSFASVATALFLSEERLDGFHKRTTSSHPASRSPVLSLKALRDTSPACCRSTPTRTRTPHAVTTYVTSVPSTWPAERLFANSEATSAPKNWALSKNLNKPGATAPSTRKLTYRRPVNTASEVASAASFSTALSYSKNR